MDKFISQNVEPLFQPNLTQYQRKQKLILLESDLKALMLAQVKLQVASVNKQLAKKSRELFILSSDNQTFKQKIEELETSLQSTKYQISTLEQQKIKQKVMSDKQINDLSKNLENLEKQRKKQIEKLKMQKQVMEESYKVKIKSIINENQVQINRIIDEQKRIQQQQSQTMKTQFEEQKQEIIKQNNSKKKQLIKKYEQEISKLTSQYEDKLYLQKKQFQEHKSQAHDTKSRFQNKVVSLEGKINRLEIQLEKEKESHSKYLKLYEETYKELSEIQQRLLGEKQTVEQQLHQVKLNLMQQQRKYSHDIKNLNSLLAKTIQQKDSKYTQTVQTMQTQFRIAIQSLQTRLVEQKQIALSEVHILRDKQNYDHQQKNGALLEQLGQLKRRYTEVSGEYERKFKKMEEDHEDYIASINSRKDYELSVTGKNAERQYTALRNKYELEIKSIYSQHANELQQISQKNKDQKIALTNKLTAQYESMINDQKVSNQIQIKQKLIEFDRKARGFQAKLKDGEKKRNQLKVAAQRVKMEMQMRVDSMVELNQAYEAEIANINQKVQNSERQKGRIANQYELKILLLKNQMKTTKEQFQQREEELKELLESKLRLKNQEMSKVLSRVKKQTELLVVSHQKRVEALEKQYNELKRVMGQKTSLPQDIEALKVFHGAYIDKQKQLETEKKKIQFLYRELRAKDAIDKVFAEKGSQKIHKNYNSNVPATLVSFKSQQF